MVIDRQRYLDKLISHMNNGLIKVITGIRRCGKTYLLFEIFYNYLLEQGVPKEKIIAVSLDDEEYAEFTDPHKLNEYIKSRLTYSDQNYYVFIDEAQYAITKEEMKNPDVPIRLYGVLNGLLRRKNVDIYVTGSNSKLRYRFLNICRLLKKISLMPGRIICTMVDFPMCWLNLMISLSQLIWND